MGVKSADPVGDYSPGAVLKKPSEIRGSRWLRRRPPLWLIIERMMDNCVSFTIRPVKKREPSVELAQGEADTDGECQQYSSQNVFAAERAVCM